MSTAAKKSSAEKFQLIPDYYQRVNPLVTGLVILIAWILFPILVFAPHVLSPILNDRLIQLAITNRSNLIKVFQIHLWLHAIESIVAMQKCRRLGLNANTTLRWMGSVAIHGIFALKYLIWPDKSARKINVH